MTGEDRQLQDIKKSAFNSNYLAQEVEAELIEQSVHLEDIIQNTPGVSSAGGTGRARFFQIRGIGERSSYEGMPNESVTILFDHIDYTGVGGILSTFGLENLEIYKGPQNTIMGPSSLAGTINAKTLSHSFLSQGQTRAQVGLESFSGRLFNLGHYQNVGTLSSSTILSHNSTHGFYENAYLKREDTNRRDEFSFRQKLKGKSWSLNLHYFDFKSGYDIFNLENTKITQSDKPGEDNQLTWGASFLKEFKLGHTKGQFLISGHNTKSFYSYDEDWGNNPNWRHLPNWNQDYDYRIAFTKSLRNFNIEQKFIYDSGGTYHTTGLFFKNNHLRSRELAFNSETVRKDLQSVFKRRRLALYHESERPLLKGYSLFFGGRLSQLLSDYRDSRAIAVTPRESLWGGHLGLKKENYKNLWVLRLARGFKAGGVNIGTTITENRRQFDDESLYELSFKHEYTAPETRLTTTNNLFLHYRQNVQVKTSYQDDPSDPSSFTFYTDNATTGKSVGFESQIRWRPQESSYQLSLHSHFMHSEYGDYIYEGRNLKGRAFSYAPQSKVRLSQSIEILKSLRLALSHTTSSSFYFGNSHNEKAPMYIHTDTFLTYQIKDLEVQIYARNLFNDRSENRGFFFGNRPPDFDNERFVQIGHPRLIGIRMSGAFNLI